MVTLSISLPDDLKAQAEAWATAGGFASVEQYVQALLRAEVSGAPAGLSVDDDDAVESLLLSRLDGESVEMDAADFAQMRAKLTALIDPPAGRP